MLASRPRLERGVRTISLMLIASLAATRASAELVDPVREPAIQRVSIAVSDLDRSLTLYSGILGLEVARVVEHPTGRIREDEHPESASRREALLVAGSTPGQVISLLESRVETGSGSRSTPMLWLEVYDYARIVAEAGALGLDVSPERQKENLDNQPVRERRITDWDGNVIVVYRLESAELLGGECVDYGATQRWQVFDDRQVYVLGTDAEASYLVTTRSRCANVLRDAREIEVAARDGSLCVDGATLTFMTGSLTFNCRIDRIESVPSCSEAHRRATERRPDWRPLRSRPHYVCIWEEEEGSEEGSAAEEAR